MKLRIRAQVLLAFALSATFLIASAPVSGSGQYLHIYMADRSIDEIEDAELRGILEEHRALYKLAALFPDLYGYDVLDGKLANEENANEVTGLMHSPAFLDSYATAINQACFTTPIGEYTCQARPDISCDGPLDQDSCLVEDGYCSENGRSCGMPAGI